MNEDRVDCLVNRLHVTCLSLLRLKKIAVYGQDPGFIELLGGFLQHSRQLMDLIRDRESGGYPHRRNYLHSCPKGGGLEVLLPPKR